MSVVVGRGHISSVLDALGVGRFILAGGAGTGAFGSHGVSGDREEVERGMKERFCVRRVG